MSYRSSRVYVAPVPKMPPGLIELMEGLSKDVLRNNPTNIYEFCADHMQKLLTIRDGKKRNKLSLQRKITKAQEIIRERAKQHHKNYDNMLQQHCFESVDDVNNSSHKDVMSIHIQQTTKALEEPLGIETEVDVAFTGEAGINSEKDNHILPESSPTQEIVDNNLPNDICTNTTLENISGPESNNQNKNIIFEELLYSNNTDMKNVNMGTDVDEYKLKDVTQKAPANKSEVINDNNFENTISGQNEVSKIFESNDIEVCSTEESNNNTQSLIKSEDFESASKILDNCQSEEDKLKSENNSEKGLCEENNVKCVNVIPEELENNLNNEVAQHNVMDLETAAITIQKVFRTFLFKSKTISIDDSTNVDINLFINENDLQNDSNSNNNANKERRGISRMDTVLQTVNEEKSLSLSTDDSSTLSSAATVIQAHIRGFLVRNKLNVNKSSSLTSLVDSDVLSGASLDIDNDQQKAKTVLNIHIVPETDQFVSRDESLLTSVDLSMDGSPPSTSNLHPHSYDLIERRKQLKREDAVQSVSPPSNNSSSKLSEDVESVREILKTEISNDSLKHNTSDDLIHKTDDEINVRSHEIQTAVENEVSSPQGSLEKLDKMCDEMDVVTPFVDEKSLEDNKGKLMHSSEFHDVVLPTKVSRSDTTIVRGE